jgi:tetratricopeptide (TPR) repeat protein
MDALGVLYTQEGRYAEAEAMFKRAIVTKPLWGTPHYNYGALLQKTGDLRRALDELKTGVELSPLSAVARRSYGDALVAAGQLDEAGLQYERAVDLEPSLPALKGLANVYLKKKRRDLAEPVLRRTIAAFPYDSASHFQLGQLLERAGRKVEAIREFEAGLSTDPRNTEARAAIRRLQEL